MHGSVQQHLQCQALLQQGVRSDAWHPELHSHTLTSRYFHFEAGCGIAVLKDQQPLFDIIPAVL